MSFIYPRDLVNGVLRVWDAFQARTAEAPAKPLKRKSRIIVSERRIAPRPTVDELTEMLDVSYHASFLVEEARRIALRLAYWPSSVKAENVLDKPIVFAAPIPFSVADVLRLAPAVEPTTSILLVEPTGGDVTARPLQIWGVLHTGSDFINVVKGVSGGALAPPNLLTISTFAPGSLTVSTIGMVLARLRAGQLVVASLTSLGRGPIGDFFVPVADTLYQEATAALGRKRFARADDSNAYPYQQYYGFFNNILRMTQERRHGGTFVIVRDELQPSDDRLRDRISIKYELADLNMWPLVSSECAARQKYHDRLFPKRFIFLTDMKSATAEQLKDLLDHEQRAKRIHNDLIEKEHFISTLAGVDGAVVITDRLRVLGFGAEITALSHVKAVKVVHEQDGKNGVIREITSFGTRHRSAIRFCSSLEDSVCFVVSQDGGVRAVKRVGAEVLLWNDVGLGYATI